MVVIFSKHASLKLRQRGLTKQRVLEILETPDYIELSYSNRQAAYKKFGRLFLKVIFTKQVKKTIIITQYWDEDFKSL